MPLRFNFAYSTAVMLTLSASVAFSQEANYQDTVQSRFENITAMVEQSESLAKELGKSGKNDAYTLMHQMLITRFTNWLRDDVRNNRKEIAALEFVGLERMLPRVIRYQKTLIDGSAQPLAVPKRVANDLPAPSGMQLTQSVVWPDGRIEKDRPVFLFGFGAFNTMRKDITWLGDLGINFSQSELGPRHVLPAKDSWNQNAISDFRTFMTESETKGILVDLLVSPHYMPDWQFQDHPEWRTHLGGFVRFPISDPAVNEFLNQTNARILREFVDLRNPWSVCIANEPVAFKWSQDKTATLKLWGKYLSGQYGNISALNKRLHTKYASFADVPAYLEPPARPLPQDAALYDWMRFNDQRLAAWMQSLQNGVASAAPGKPTHIKMIERSFQLFDLMQGVDLDLFSRVGALAGTDIGMGYSPPDAKKRGILLDPTKGMLEYSLLRSSAGRPIANTENHILRDRSDEEVPVNRVAASVWLEAISGMSASAAWTWDRVNSTNSTFFGLFPHRPDAMEEYMRAGLDLMRLMPEVSQIVNEQPQVAVLYSRTSMLRNPDAPKSLFAAYQVLNQTGIPFVAITEQTLSESDFQKRFPQVRAIVLPGVTHMPDNTWAGLVSYLKTGFAANESALINIGDGQLPKDPYGYDRGDDIFSDNQIISMQVSADNPDAMPERLKQSLGQLGIKPAYCFVDAATGHAIENVVIRGTHSKTPLVFIANMNDKSVQGVWRSSHGTTMRQSDLIAPPAQPDAQTTMTLEPLEVRMGPIIAAP